MVMAKPEECDCFFCTIGRAIAAARAAKENGERHPERGQAEPSHQSPQNKYWIDEKTGKPMTLGQFTDEVIGIANKIGRPIGSSSFGMPHVGNLPIMEALAIVDRYQRCVEGKP